MYVYSRVEFKESEANEIRDPLVFNVRGLRDELRIWLSVLKTQKSLET